MKKRLVTLTMALCLACSLVIPVGASAVEPTSAVSVESPVLELEYMDFYENQDYYMSLVRDHDYTLHFNVDEEYQELENARLAKSSGDVDALVPVVARGTVVPTTAHDITKGLYKFNGTSPNRALYTDVYCVGSSWYIVTVNNHIYSNQQLTVTAYNVLSSQTTSYFPAGTTIKKYTMSGSGATASSKHFYLCFGAPVDVSGTIERYTG